MNTRRRFLQQSAIVSLSPWLPTFVSRGLRAEDMQSTERILLVIQLDGGNDGLNTVIPFSDPLYARHRSELLIPAKDVLKLNADTGLHRSLKPVSDLLEDGRVAIVQGVGYPNPNRSHFESMAIWHHGRIESNSDKGTGWLGRAADLDRQQNSSPDSISIGEDSIPAALLGHRANTVALANETDLQMRHPITTNTTASDSNDLHAFISRTVHQSYAAARTLETSSSENRSTYPSTELSQKLQLASRLIKLDGATRVYYVSQAGYDTHSLQRETHSTLLREFSDALKAFLDDMRGSGLDDRIAVLAFSEFGRRVQENGSAGTDHGAAGPVILAGRPVKPGIVGHAPDLTDLDDGDIKSQFDFRRVYATILDDWLNVPSEKVLGEKFERLPLLNHQVG